MTLLHTDLERSLRPPLAPASPHVHLPPPQLFRSFWMAGFESACQINTRRRRIDMIAATQHDAQCATDYALVRSLGIRTVRDGVRWPIMETRPGHYTFAPFDPMLRAALDQSTQVIWNLCHYGWPEDLDFFLPAFVDRFARFAGAVARFVREHTDEVPFYTPINEISFLGWAMGTKGFIHPVAPGRGWEVKCQLVRASIAAMEAIWQVDRRARFVHVDPVIHVVCPRGRPDLAHAAREQHKWQFHAWDLLCGRIPDVGGAMKYLDIMGLNYYHSNQFEHPDVRLRWEDQPRDERFVPLHQLLAQVVARYGRPIFIAETSHFGEGRALWMHEMAEEVLSARLRGVPLQGVCLYPILDRPDWEDPDHWHNSGLFDLVRDQNGTLHRVLNRPYASAVRQAQQLLDGHGCR